LRHGLVIFDGSRGAPCSGDDIQLVRAVLRRDRKATAEFVSRYSDDLFAYLARRLSPRVDLAEDLLQEVFLAAWESLAGFEGRSSLRSWLFGIAKHKVEGHYREQLRAPSRLEEDCHASDVALAQDPVLDERLDQERQETRAQEILRALPERYRVALLWRYWERRNAVEMAAATGRSVKAIERLLSRARAQFKHRWNERFGGAAKEARL
jgi:RNA polymerase sigma-70 factor (ECF subfamily)